MTVENQDAAQNDDQKKPEDTVEGLKEKLEASAKSIEALESKVNELLGETKAAKEKRRKAEEDAEKARLDQLELDRKNGEFEKVYNFEKGEKEKLAAENATLKKEKRDNNINNVAMQIASELTKGDSIKGGLLQPFIVQTLTNMADETGKVDDSVVQSVKKQFGSDPKYMPLMATNLAGGGGAPGGDSKKPNVSLRDMTGLERTKLYRENRQEYDRLKALENKK